MLVPTPPHTTGDVSSTLQEQAASEAETTRQAVATAEAVIASLERARAAPGVLGSVPITAFEAAKGEVVIRLSRPFVALPAFLAHASAQVLGPASGLFYGHGFASQWPAR